MSEHTPITGELRELMGGVEPRVDEDGVVTAKYVTPEAWAEFARRCDAIDAVHAGLERENAELRERVAVLDNERVNMHDGGSITGELRKWAKGSTLSSWTAEHLTAIADRIDAEHQKALDEWKAEHGQMWLKGYAECHAELLEGNETLASDLERCGWIRLPKDANGEYIHVGDEMCGYGWPNGGVYCRAIVNEVTILVGPQDGAYRGWLMWAANECRHHHAPTVEDVLTKFGIDWEYESNCEDRAALLKEYAKRLTLAGDAE